MILIPEMDSDKETSNGSEAAFDNDIELRFVELCRDINMDNITMENAWQSYKEIKTKYTLEGDNLHWLICSLYSACRASTQALHSVSGEVMKGNLMSLTKILEKAKFSFTGFLKKMDTWLQMSPDKLLKEHIDVLECNFRVSTVVFKKFAPIFLDVFRSCEPSILERSLKSASSSNQRRANRRMTCSSDDVFKFCWMLFVHAKGTECQAIGGEVLPSFQLLLCAVNLCFKNALCCAHRRSLLNHNFPGLPEGWDDDDYVASEAELPDVISLLVQRHVELSREEVEQFILQTQVLSRHTWTKYISNLPSMDVTGGPNHLFQANNFEANSKKLVRLYEEFILTEGDFDERVFLKEDADDQLGTPIKMRPSSSARLPVTTATRMPSVGINNNNNNDNGAEVDVQRCKRTPLTNREYLVGKERSGSSSTTSSDSHRLTVSSAFRSSDAQKLRKLLVSSSTSPSQTLTDIFKSCSEDIESPIKERLNILGNQFMQAYTVSLGMDGTYGSSNAGVAEQRLVLTKMMYFNVLEKIVLQERRRVSNKTDLTNLLKREDFNNLLFTCCLEIVLYSCDSQRSFPWALEALDISPYYFYKIVELVIRAEESLSGSIIKHLIYVEEQILEQLAWKAESPLWEAMDKLNNPTAPLCSEVNFSYNIGNSNDDASSSSSSTIRSEPAGVATAARLMGGGSMTGSNPAGGCGVSPLTHPRVKAVVGGDIMLRKSESSSAQDRFCSPSAGSAKRRLTFKQGAASVVTTATPPSSSANGGADSIATAPPVISLITTSTNNSVVKKRIVMTPLTKDCAVRSGVGSGGKTYLINSTLAGGAKCTNITLVTSSISKPTTTASSLAPTTTHTSAVDPQTSQSQAASCKPKKTGSLALFWRKIYHLACVRLRHLCDQLSISGELPQRIWTCFEHSIAMNRAALMKERHIDQLLMCAVYVMAKVTRHEQSFQEIMRCYRNQPQATSCVYRNVLISSTPPEDADEDDDEEERDDLIQFYNRVYVPLMREYVKKFSTSSSSSYQPGLGVEGGVGRPGSVTSRLEVPCSPMPRQRAISRSPRRVASNQNVYVSPMKTRPCVSPSSNHLEYNFQRSPSKNLKEINSMLREQAAGMRMANKRVLPFTLTCGSNQQKQQHGDDEGGSDVKQPRVASLITNNTQQQQST